MKFSDQERRRRSERATAQNKARALPPATCKICGVVLEKWPSGARRTYCAEHGKAARKLPRSEKTKRRMSEVALLKRAEMTRRAKMRGPYTPEWRMARSEDARTGKAGFRLSKKSVFIDRKGRSFRMRSVWEVLLARWLDKRVCNWDYEPFSIALTNGRVYIPDFQLESGKLLEVKGYFTSSDKMKIELARGMGYRVQILNRALLERLKVLNSRGSPLWLDIG